MNLVEVYDTEPNGQTGDASLIQEVITRQVAASQSLPLCRTPVLASLLRVIYELP